MSQIKQILQLKNQGHSIKGITRELGIARGTVRSVYAKMQEAKWSTEELLSMEDAVLESRFYAGNAAYTEERFNELKNKLDYYAAELERPHVTKRLLWEEYRSEFPDGYGHSQFQHHLLQHVRAKNPVMVLEHKPAEKLYIDFAGKTTHYIDRQTGEMITCQLFVACLPYSNYFFAMAVPSQKLEDFIHALVCCIVFLGGVPQLLVPDNMKTAVVKASRYEPEINQALEDLANHYGTVVLPTRVARPRDKSSVEGHVKIAYTQIYARLRNRQFFSLEDLNKAIEQCMIRLNQTRMQNKSFSRQEKFLAQEKPLLKSLPDTLFQIRHYRKYKVAKNNFILLTEDRHYYSVPFRYIGQHVKVIYTRSLVEVYLRGERIAVHPRDKAPHKYSIVKDHLASHHRHYLERSPDYYIEQSGRICSQLSELFKKIFSGDQHPEVLYKSCDGILALSRKSELSRIERACEIALQTGHYSYGFFSNLIKNNITGLTPYQQSDKPLPKHNNVRGKDYYKQQLTFNL